MRGTHARKRPWWRRSAPLVVIIAVALGAAGGAWAVIRSSSAPTAAATASTSTSDPLPSPTTEAPATRPAPSTSTRAPTTVAISPPVSAPGSLTYRVATGTTIKVVASNPCWVEVRATAGGPIVEVTTLQAGHQLSLPSPLWIRLGNPANVRVTAGTTALRLPVGTGDLVITSAPPDG